MALAAATQTHTHFTSKQMKFDFLLVLRHLKKNKAHGFIHSLGLSVGISACLVIYLIASFELSFDKFQPDRDRIYRVYTQYKSNNVVQDYPGIYTGAVNTIRDHVAGIEAFAHLHSWWGKVEIENGFNQHKVFEAGNNFVFADPNFFKVFSIYKWLQGSPESSLNDPYRVVLTESRARIYFGELPLEQIIGKEVIYKDSLHFYVSGIVADIKENTDFTFTDFISYSTGEKLGKNTPFSFEDPYTLNNDSRLFIKVAKNIAHEKILAQFHEYETRNLPNDFIFKLKLQPLSDLHFNTTLGIFAFNARLPVKKSTIEILIALALALLLIAVINFINLETAQSSKRAKEVGVRKVLGSSRWNLVRYFLVESFVLTFLSVLLSVGLAICAFDYFKEFIPHGVKFNLLSLDLFIFLLLCLICIPILAGIYPAFVLSSYQPTRALKNLTYHSSRTSQSSLIRKVLTIFQFFFSHVLIILTIVVGLQLRYMVGKDLGFTTKAIITFHAPLQASSMKKLVTRNSLEQIEGVEMISMQSQPPSGADGANSLFLVFESEKETLEYWVNVKYGDANYLNLYDIQLIAGSNFISGDSSHAYIINEAYMHKLGVSNPRDIIGKTASGKPIIGVVKDFHSESLHSVIQPTVIVFDASKLHSFGMKLGLSEDNPEKLMQILNKIESVWSKINPNEKFEFSFIENRIRNYYESEERINKLVSVATCITIFISCLGLFALSSFTALERTKEIGIRKVMGASVNHIVFFLSSEFLKLVVIAIMLSTPLAFYIGDKWLTGFAFKIDLSVWIFLISGILSVTLAFTVISFRIIKTANSDPVKSLRYE
jgi:ABC-type antimicrobial peptide transport system permease subunit